MLNLILSEFYAGNCFFSYNQLFILRLYKIVRKMHFPANVEFILYYLQKSTQVQANIQY